MCICEREIYGNGVHVCTQRELEQCERDRVKKCVLGGWVETEREFDALLPSAVQTLEANQVNRNDWAKPFNEMKKKLNIKILTETKSFCVTQKMKMTTTARIFFPVFSRNSNSNFAQKIQSPFQLIIGFHSLHYFWRHKRHMWCCLVWC